VEASSHEGHVPRNHLRLDQDGPSRGAHALAARCSRARGTRPEGPLCRNPTPSGHVLRRVVNHLACPDCTLMVACLNRDLDDR
jgi:hypothetical protein